MLTSIFQIPNKQKQEFKNFTEEMQKLSSLPHMTLPEHLNPQKTAGLIMQQEGGLQEQKGWISSLMHLIKMATP